jgi:hypothetical protein
MLSPARFYTAKTQGRLCDRVADLIVGGQLRHGRASRSLAFRWPLDAHHWTLGSLDAGHWALVVRDTRSDQLRLI